MPVIPNHNIDDELATLKKAVPVKSHYNAIIKAFEMLVWGPTK